MAERTRPVFGIETRSIRPLIVLMALLVVACGEKPTVSSVGKATAVGGIEFTVGEYDVRYLEISEGDATYEYPRPVLVIPVTMKNVGESSFVYSPTHSAQQMSEASTPLLYLDPGAEAELPPESKTSINGVFLEKGSPTGQVRSATTLEKGASVEDIFLFEVPDAANELVFSMPPAMHRGKMPVLFRLSFTPKEAKGPKVYSIDEAIEFEGVSFKVTGSEIAYVKIDDSAQGEGYSTDPLFKISYEITNKSEATVEYDPGHNAVGTRGAALFDARNSYKRVKFAATTTVEEQKTEGMKLEPGKTVKDFVLFEVPDEESAEVVLEYPASLFERAGLARVQLPFEFKKPDKPKELTKADKDG